VDRTYVSADRPWARVAGYSRAVRVGNVIEVSGTAPAGPDGAILAPGDPYEQARTCLRLIGEALEQAGGSFRDVVRTRMFVADAARWEAVGRANGEVFADIRPATTLVAGSGFVDPGILVEIEATAVVEAT